MDIFQLKAKLATMGKELERVNNELYGHLDDPEFPKAELDKLRAHKADVEERFNDLKTELEKAVKEQEARLAEQVRIDPVVTDERMKLIGQKAKAIRAFVLGGRDKEVIKVLNLLQALPAGGGTGGEYLLPTELSTELIQEPLVTNPLRGNIRATNISGLELPKIAFELATNDQFVGDDTTAKELEATGDKVTFGRHKSKVMVKIADTVLHSSDLDLVNYVEMNLRSGLAKKEKQTSFVANASAESGCGNMTFYEEDTGTPVIEEVTGATLYEAIINAIADLHEDFREGAKVCMKFSDYVGILLTLANNNMSLFAAPPEQIIGKPCIFCDSATTPVIGNFNYYHLNYDGQPIYDTDKDVEKGNYKFVLTAWFDQWRLLNSAFRLAVCEESV